MLNEILKTASNLTTLGHDLDKLQTSAAGECLGLYHINLQQLHIYDTRNLRAKKVVEDRQKALMSAHDEIVDIKSTYDADGKLAKATLGP